MKKALKILIVLPLLYLVFMPVYFAKSINNQLVTGVEIILSDSAEYNFITIDHLYDLLFSSYGQIVGKPVKEISLEGIEQNMKTIKELRMAEAYTTIDGKLVIWTEQRRPIMRVMPDEGGDYFVDNEGIVIRRRNSYNPRLHIVVGNINISQAMLNGVSVLDTTIKNSTLRDVYHLVKHISKDNFWSAQIDQIYVDRSNAIELIPRVGNHVIRLGTVDDLEDKFINLEAFYKNVLPEVGWNKYSVINLEFKNQIVCKKR
jgi:cell division protein FtsQ